MFLKITSRSPHDSLTPSALGLFLFHAPSALVLFLKKAFKEILKYPEKKLCESTFGKSSKPTEPLKSPRFNVFIFKYMYKNRSNDF